MLLQFRLHRIALASNMSPPDHIRSDNGSEFTAHAVRDWLGRIGVKTLYIEPGSPWENGYNESLQLKAPGRNPEHGDLLYIEGGQSADRTMRGITIIPSLAA